MGRVIYQANTEREAKKFKEGRDSDKANSGENIRYTLGSREKWGVHAVKIKGPGGEGGETTQHGVLIE